VTSNDNTNWLQNDVCDLMLSEEVGGSDLDSNVSILWEQFI